MVTDGGKVHCAPTAPPCGVSATVCSAGAVLVATYYRNLSVICSRRHQNKTGPLLTSRTARPHMIAVAFGRIGTVSATIQTAALGGLSGVRIGWRTWIRRRSSLSSLSCAFGGGLAVAAYAGEHLQIRRYEPARWGSVIAWLAGMIFLQFGMEERTISVSRCLRIQYRRDYSGDNDHRSLCRS